MAFSPPRPRASGRTDGCGEKGSDSMNEDERRNQEQRQRQLVLCLSRWAGLCQALALAREALVVLHDLLNR